jgi:histidinol-phosphate aminotransferase
MTSLIRKNVAAMQGYIPGEQPRGRDIVKLNTNENPYPPSPRVEEALAACAADALRRYPDPACAELRAAIAALHACRVDQVFVGNGSDEVLALCTRAFVEDDGLLAYVDPSYSLYPVLAEIRAVETCAIALDADFAWPRDPRAGGPQLPPPGRHGLFILTNPNAPTGMLFAEADVRALCERVPGVVVIDEAYVDFADRSALGLALQRDNVLIVRTLSKSYSLAGARCGYAVGPAPLIDALGRIKDSYNLSVMAQRAATAALRDQAHMTANAERIKRTRAALSRELTLRGFEVCPSATNFVWTRPPTPGAAVLFEQLRAQGIYVRYFKGPVTGAHLRITVGTDREIITLLRAVDDILARKA